MRRDPYQAHPPTFPRNRRRPRGLRYAIEPQPRGVRLDHLFVALLIIAIVAACVALWRGVQVEFSAPTVAPQPTARVLAAPAPPRVVVAPAAPPVVVEQVAPPVEAVPVVKGELGGKAHTLPAPPPKVEQPAPVEVGVGELGGRVNDLPAPPPMVAEVQAVVEPVKGELNEKPIEPTPAKGKLGGRAKP